MVTVRAQLLLCRNLLGESFHQCLGLLAVADQAQSANVLQIAFASTFPTGTR